MLPAVWERLADLAAGTVAGLALAPTGGAQPDVFAATPTGVHVSHDGGRSWRRTSDELTPVLVGAVAASPDFARDQMLFAAARDGLYTSADAGRTWRLRLSGNMLSVAVSPQFASTPTLLVGTDADGVLISHDAGSTWASANPGLRDRTVSALVMSPAFETDGTALAGTPTGLYITRNGAKSWRSVEIDCDEPAIECVAVAFDFARSGVMLAATESCGLWRSTDRGATWSAVTELGHQSITALAFDTSSPRCVAVSSAGLAVSPDGSHTWCTPRPLPGLGLSVACVDGGRQRDLVLAGLLHAGLVYSTDSGATWLRPQHAPSANLLTQVVCSPAFARDRTVYAAGLDSGVLVSRDAGVTWQSGGGDIAGMPVLSLDLSSAADQTLYAGTPRGLFVSANQARDWRPAGVFQHVSLVAVAAPGAPVLAAADGRVVRSLDAGSTWSVMDVPFDTAEVSSFAFLTSGDARQAVLAATYSARRRVREVWCSRDGGDCWERLLELTGDVPLVLARGQSADSPLLVGDGQRVYHATHRRAVNLPAAITALVVTRDIVHRLLAATTTGVYVSSDEGHTFSRLGEGGPGVVMAAAVTPDQGPQRALYALELGGGVWAIRSDSEQELERT